MVKALRYIQVEPILPEGLEKLRVIASNLHWSWNLEAIDLFRRIDTKLWEESGHNPTKVLALISQERLNKLKRDSSFLAQLDHVHRDLEIYLQSETWFSEKHLKTDSPQIAYFSAEFGITECLPIYSGGLGILAGDHLKSASDLGIPLVGVGLLYQRGYFQQYLNPDGWQQEYYPELDFSLLPLEEIKDENGAPLTISVEFPNRDVIARIWKLQVGRVPLYLLDTNLLQNEASDREITSELYGGDQEMRIKQELILGIGGVRALEALGLSPLVYHMNEGHSAFLGLARVRRRMQEDNLSFREAAMLAKQSTVFTTHTPVPAGIDRFPRELVDRYLRPHYSALGLSPAEFFAMGHQNSQSASGEFNMAYLAMSFSSFINGVSELHSQVSRKMWQMSWPDVPNDEIPIEYVTNGVHARSWIATDLVQLYNRYLGLEWMKEPANHSVWDNVDDILDNELWKAHETRREKMIAYVRRSLKAQYERRGATPGEIKSISEVLNPEYLTIGFARRFAAYKRGNLLFRDIRRLKEIINKKDRPIQIIFAGKAHPRDNLGKELIKSIIHAVRDPELRDKIVFIENYDISTARYLVQGVDVWLNTPRRPLEASGTSGMKVVFNGGLNLSVLDGWWCEGYNSEVGWAIGSGEEYDNHDYQDEVEANALYDLLEKEVAPAFYDRREDGIPRHWLEKMKASIRTLSPMFNSNRMVEQYTEKFYLEAHRQYVQLQENGFDKLKRITEWHKKLVENWSDLRIIEVKSHTNGTIKVDQNVSVEAKVFVGEVQPEDIRVELYVGRLSQRGEIADAHAFEMTPVDKPQSSIVVYSCEAPMRQSGRLGYSVRILPNQRDLVRAHEFRLITWADSNI